MKERALVLAEITAQMRKTRKSGAREGGGGIGDTPPGYSRGERREWSGSGERGERGEVRVTGAK